MTATTETLPQTRSLFFRPWSEQDLELALGLWGDPRVTGLIDVRKKLSPEDVRERLYQEIACQRSHGVQYWPVFLKAGGEHVGCCGLRPYDLEGNVWEIGAHMLHRHWGQGLATEAILGAMVHAFDVRTVAALFAGHNPHNRVSRHLLRKLGFRYTHDEYYTPTGLQHPSYLLTADEYRIARGNTEKATRQPRREEKQK